MFSYKINNRLRNRIFQMIFYMVFILSNEMFLPLSVLALPSSLTFGK